MITERLLLGEGDETVGFARVTVVIAGIVSVVQTLLFALGIMQKTARPTVDVFLVNALLFHGADGLVICFVVHETHS